MQERKAGVKKEETTSERFDDSALSLTIEHAIGIGKSVCDFWIALSALFVLMQVESLQCGMQTHGTIMHTSTCSHTHKHTPVEVMHF